MIFVDTGAWYAWYVESDTDHDRAAAWFATADDRLVTTDYVIDELLTLLKIRGYSKIAFAAGELLFSGEPCQIEYLSLEDIDSAWEVFSGYRDKQ